MKIEDRFTSFELSKMIWDAGCRLKTIELGDKDFYTFIIDGEVVNIPAYDLLWDVCVKYAKEIFFNENIIIDELELHWCVITKYLLLNKKQEAEDYIWLHCKFNTEAK